MKQGRDADLWLGFARLSKWRPKTAANRLLVLRYLPELQTAGRKRAEAGGRGRDITQGYATDDGH
jgi:hypothetical protein